MAVSKYDKEHLSEADQATIADVTSKAERGEMSWDEAHNTAQTIRANNDLNGFGYNGGNLGDDYHPFTLNTTNNTGAGNVETNLHVNGDDSGGLLANQYWAENAGKSGKSEDSGFSYGTAPQYTSRYQQQIDDLARQIMGANYQTWQQGADYAALSEQYTRNAQRGMQDTLGQVSARTGGLASSYAGSAAQQTYNNYMDQLNAAARQMYNDDIANKRANMSMLQGLEQSDYGRYADQLQQWNTDRNFDYNQYTDDRAYNYQTSRDAINDSRYEDETAYNRGRDQLADQRYEDETAYSRENDSYNRLYNTAILGMQYGDTSGLKALGYSDEQISKIQARIDEDRAYDIAAKKKSLSASSGGSKTSSTKTSGMKLSVAQNMAASGQWNDDVLNAFLNEGYSPEYLAANYDGFEDWYASKSDSGSNDTGNYYELGNTKISEQAKNVYQHVLNQAQNNDENPFDDAYLDWLSAQLDRGVITEDELNAILTAIGVD